MGVIEASGRAWKVVQMSENVSAAEWLRGIIDECGVSGTRSCTAIAEAFGIDCKHEKTCRDCITKMMTAIADRIDAERALPEGVEWPRFEDGELVKIGDEVEYGGKALEVDAICFDREEWSMALRRNLDISRMSGSYDERVKRPTLKVLGADGVEIRVGDTVYCNGEDKPLVVSHIVDSTKVTLIADRVSYFRANPSRLSHERPDSWRLWGDDLDMAAKVGEVDKVEMMRRAKALAKAGE